MTGWGTLDWSHYYRLLLRTENLVLEMRKKRSLLPKQYPHSPCWSRFDVVAQNNAKDVCVPVVTER